jgi:hypothetical protein
LEKISIRHPIPSAPVLKAKTGTGKNRKENAAGWSCRKKTAAPGMKKQAASIKKPGITGNSHCSWWKIPAPWHNPAGTENQLPSRNRPVLPAKFAGAEWTRRKCLFCHQQTQQKENYFFHGNYFFPFRGPDGRRVYSDFAFQSLKNVKKNPP